MQLTINLHRPHSKQLAFKRSQAKRRVIVAGRRGGKTVGLADIAVEAMLKGRRVLEAAPTADQTIAFWDTVKAALAEPINAGVINKWETTRLVEMKNGGRIRAKTAHNADGLRGDYADLLILDEFADMDPSAWAQVGAPMLLDNGGDAVFIGTPKRKNHLFAAYQRAISDTTGRWAAFHFTSHDNPYLDAEALDEITFDMTDEDYRQEILAEFLDNEGAVFRNISANMTAPAASPRHHAGHYLVVGVDWGKAQDYTAFSVGCVDCRCEVFRDRFNQIDYTLQRGRLNGVFERWRPVVILAESNAMGEPIIEQLQADGLPVVKFATTATSKPPLIENMALALEREEWSWQDDPIWTGELEAYERTISPQTGRSRYNAPPGVHDDTVMARCLMLWQATQGKIDVANNPFYE
jgi:hypothetical protein